jgi:ribosomal protein S18 acetylase RimI-like enzyme
MTLFRSARPTDLSRLNALVNSAYRGDSSKKGWTTEADLLDGQRTDPEKLLEMISEPNATIELAFADASEKTLLGCVYLKIDGGDCYLGMLTVDPVLQAKGIGKAILIHSEQIAKERNCERIRMTVIESRTELLEFYERRGYQKTGKTEPFPENDPRFGIPKTKLVFLELAKTL